VTRWLLRPSALVGGVILVALVPLIVLDVALRYVLNAPLRGAFELTQLAMVGVAFLGLGEAQARAEHITIDLLHERLGALSRRLLNRFARIASFLVTLAIGWQLIVYATRLRADHEVSGVLGIPLFLVVGVAAVGFGLFALALVVDR
jgi:TRAP-type C4-dicarboxylate transport system permease small subunit